MVSAKKHNKIKNQRRFTERKRQKGKFINKYDGVELNKTISFRCSSNLKESIKSFADDEGVNITTLILNALVETYGDILVWK